MKFKDIFFNQIYANKQNKSVPIHRKKTVAGEQQFMIYNRLERKGQYSITILIKNQQTPIKFING